MAGTIGIKIANGDFYPILEEHSSSKKKLVLTTVHDGQESVQIDLFRSLSRSMLDAQYIGSLVVENINPRRKGEPSIEMVISSGEDGNIAAEAWVLDTASSDHNLLNVSLKTMDSTDPEESFPDFDLERPDPQTTPVGLYDMESSRKKKHKFPWLLTILIILLLLIAGGLVWYYFFGGKDIVPFTLPNPFVTTQQSVSPEPAPAPEPPPPPPPPPPPEPEPVLVVEPEPEPVVVADTVPEPEPEPVVVAEPVVIQAPVAPPPARTPVARVRPPAPVTSYRVPAVIPRNGAPYQLRWGDTLWDISEAFYRNPWLYQRIARYNNISNPDLIISGRTIRIPPLN